MERGEKTAVQIVVTPGSGNGVGLRTARRLCWSLRKRGHDSTIRSFDQLGTLMHWARTCKPWFTHLVCVGGDATLSATALAAVRCGVPFVPVPTGFGNIFARVFGHRGRVDDVVGLLEHGEVWKVDVGQAGQEIFLSHRSYGYLDDVQNAVEESRDHPRNRFRRHLAYYAAAQRVLRGPLPRIRVEVDRALIATDAVVVTVANVETYRGFLSLTPRASPIAGRFDVFVVSRRSKARLAATLLKLLFRLPGRWDGVAIHRGRRVSVQIAGRREQLRTVRAALPLLIRPGAVDELRQRLVEENVPVATVA
jgi:diacylglycerol kinase (ATP)